MNRKVIAIDFDGTITTGNNFPEIMPLRENAKEVIKELQENGYFCFLWTCRQGKFLIDAIKFLERNGIELYGYNQSPYDISINCGRKAIADYYIDDCAMLGKEINWLEIKDYFIKGKNL